MKTFFLLFEERHAFLFHVFGFSWSLFEHLDKVFFSIIGLKLENYFKREIHDIGIDVREKDFGGTGLLVIAVAGFFFSLLSGFGYDLFIRLRSSLVIILVPGGGVWWRFDRLPTEDDIRGDPVSGLWSPFTLDLAELTLEELLGLLAPSVTCLEGVL